MRAFRYVSPETPDAVVAALVEHGEQAAVLAGGTDLLSLMKDDIATPEVLISLRRVESLRGVATLSTGGVSIGATTTLAQILESVELRAYRGLVQALEGIYSPQMRNMGTLGGELLQRPRCWYYRAGFGLLAQQGGASMPERGDNRYHAIFDQGPARFVSPSSSAPALISLGASAELLGRSGSRQVAVADLFRAPTSNGESEHTLEPGEVLVALRLPAAPAACATYEVRHRKTLDWPLATASVAWRENEGKVSEPHVVLGHVAATPWIARATAEALEGQEIASLDRKQIERIADLAVADARPLSGNGYKVHLARTAVKRAIERALEREA